MAVKGTSRDVFSGAEDILGKSALVDVIVATAGGDYALLSDACDGEATNSIIGLAPPASGTSYTEIADIEMKAGQHIVALDGNNGSIDYDLNGYELHLANYATVEGVNFSADFNDADYSKYAIYCDGDNFILRDIRLSLGGTSSQYGVYLNDTDLSRIENIRIEGNDNLHRHFSGTAACGRNIITDIFINEANFSGESFYLSGNHNQIDNIYVMVSSAMSDTSSYGIEINSNSIERGNTISNLSVINPDRDRTSNSGVRLTGNHDRQEVTNIFVTWADDALYITGTGQHVTNYTCYGVNRGIVFASEDTEWGKHILTNCDIGLVSDIGIDSGTSITYFQCIFTNIRIKLTAGNTAGIDLYGTNHILDDIHIERNDAADTLIIIRGDENKLSSFMSADEAGVIDIDGNRNRLRNCSFYASINDSGNYNIVNGYYEDSSAPGVNNDISQGFERNDIWRDTTTTTCYRCIDPTDGAAVWTVVGSGGSGFNLVTVTEADSPVSCAVGTQYDNIGASAAVTLNLPTAARGKVVRFMVREAEDMIITAAAGDDIQVATETTVAAGTVTGNDISAVIELLAIDDTTWVTPAASDQWVVETT